jgi:PPM family protein phosphatase
VSESLAEGGIDNITVIVADVVDGGGTEGAVVLGAAEERVIPPSETRLRDGAGDSEVEDTLVTERPLVTVDDEARYTPRAPGKRRLARPLVGVLVLLLIAAAGLSSAYAWTRTQYYVGVSADHVAIYQGLSDGVPGVRLSRVFEVQPLSIGDLPPYYQDQVRANIDVPNLQAARETIVELTAAAERCTAKNPPRESPRPTPRATTTPTSTPATTPSATPAGPGGQDC